MPGRPEIPIDPDAGPVARFAIALRKRRTEAGNPPYRTMATKAHYSPAALSQAAAGRRLATWDVVRAFLAACNVSELELQRWKEEWEETNQAVRPATASLPATKVGVAPASPTAVMRLQYVTDLDGFRDVLSMLRRERRLSLRQVADSTGNAFSKSTIADMLTGKITLRAEMVEAYLTACGLPADDITEWSTILRRLTFQHKRAQAALQAARLALVTDEPVPAEETPPPAVEADTVVAEPCRGGGAHRRRGLLAQLWAKRPRRRRTM